MDGGDNEHQGLLAPTPEVLGSVKVYPLIPSLKKDVVVCQLHIFVASLASDKVFLSQKTIGNIVRPIVQKYARLKNMATVYACLVVRSYFLSACEVDLAYAGVMYSRAMLCEILAMKLLSHFASNDIQLVAVLTTPWNPLAGATSEIVDQVRLAVGGKEDELAQSALEQKMAIATKAKAFFAAPVTQKVVNDMYYGRIVFTIFGHRSILRDHYKSRAIELYDSSKSPFIDHYRQENPLKLL
ncbi:hypothetical protein H0H87_007994 [Tephrocybe sp. NHM501043]|nr:hypothetical protein H0H87_007994 [Tephrocybe sp. NHM501043]